MQNVIDLLNSHLKENDTVILALSGGPDSMVLLDLLSKINHHITIVCAHVNHKWRKASDNEYLFLEQYVKNKGYVFEGIELNLQFKNNYEANAREARYEFFNYLKTKYKAKYILTAHHGDDQIETILMRISRGSNLSGYAGLKCISNYYFKPLLLVTKNDILNYAKSNNIPYFIDKSNFKLVHTRNKYRKIVLPFLKRENKLAHLKYNQFSNELMDYYEFVTDYILDRKFIIDNYIDIKNIKNETEFIKRKTVELLIKNIQKNYEFYVDKQNVDEILTLLNTKKSNSKILLGNDFIAIKSYDKLFIEKNNNPIEYDTIFDNYFENDLFIIKKANNANEKSNNIIRLSLNEIELPLHVRSKKNGDVIELKNSGHKKIKDIFIDEKISLSERKSYPIVVDNQDRILWIPNIKKSKFDKEKNEKYDIILASERKNKYE